jgi:hypothetical protein
MLRARVTPSWQLDLYDLVLILTDELITKHFGALHQCKLIWGRRTVFIFANVYDYSMTKAKMQQNLIDVFELRMALILDYFSDVAHLEFFAFIFRQLGASVQEVVEGGVDKRHLLIAFCHKVTFRLYSPLQEDS